MLGPLMSDIKRNKLYSNLFTLISPLETDSAHATINYQIHIQVSLE